MEVLNFHLLFSHVQTNELYEQFFRIFLVIRRNNSIADSLFKKTLFLITAENISVLSWWCSFNKKLKSDDFLLGVSWANQSHLLWNCKEMGQFPISIQATELLLLSVMHFLNLNSYTLQNNKNRKTSMIKMLSVYTE